MLMHVIERLQINLSGQREILTDHEEIRRSIKDIVDDFDIDHDKQKRDNLAYHHGFLATSKTGYQIDDLLVINCRE